jgi:hypothetical protein
VNLIGGCLRRIRHAFSHPTTRTPITCANRTRCSLKAGIGVTNAEQLQIHRRRRSLHKHPPAPITSATPQRRPPPPTIQHCSPLPWPPVTLDRPPLLTLTPPAPHNRPFNPISTPSPPLLARTPARCSITCIVPRLQIKEARQRKKALAAESRA